MRGAKIVRHLPRGEQTMLILNKRVPLERDEHTVHDPMGRRPVGKDLVVHFIRTMHLVKDKLAHRTFLSDSCSWEKIIILKGNLRLPLVYL